MTTQEAYERYAQMCKTLWNLEPAPIEVFERQLGSISGLGGSIASQSSFLGKSGTS